jgi:hypothetical protein
MLAGELMLRAREKQPVQERTEPPRRDGTGIRITGSTIVRFRATARASSDIFGNHHSAPLSSPTCQSRAAWTRSGCHSSRAAQAPRPATLPTPILASRCTLLFTSSRWCPLSPGTGNSDVRNSILGPFGHKTLPRTRSLCIFVQALCGSKGKRAMVQPKPSVPRSSIVLNLFGWFAMPAS